MLSAGDHNWRGGSSWSRIYACTQRHLLAWYEGETYDPESGLNHLAHAAADIAFLLEWHKTRPELDDRWHTLDAANLTSELIGPPPITNKAHYDDTLDPKNADAFYDKYGETL